MSTTGASTQSPVRLRLERVGNGLVAAASLLVPLIIGLLFYLALVDSIALNADDPLNEVRLWMIREARGATGLGFSIANPTTPSGNAQCSQTRVTFLRWDRALRIETTDVSCRCYSRKGNQVVDSGACP